MLGPEQTLLRPEPWCFRLCLRPSHGVCSGLLMATSHGHEVLRLVADCGSFSPALCC